MNVEHMTMNHTHAESSERKAPDLRQVDLNLLVAFDALAEERSVTGAAAKLGITQSAMSHTLKRLRVLFEDPLFVRTRGEFQPTPRAEELVVPLRSSMVDLTHLLSGPSRFDARTSKRIFKFTSPDLLDLLLLPLLYKKLLKQAPQSGLNLVPMPERAADLLETGELDLALLPALLKSDAPFGPSAASHLMQRRVHRDSFRAYVRKGHALATRRSLSLSRFVSLEHLLVSPTGKGPGLVDDYLKEQGLARRVSLRVATHSSALQMLAHSDLILTAPSSLTRLPDFKKRFVSFAVPLPLPEHTLNIVWHPRYTHEPGHRWFRDTIANVMKEWG